ncbi:hypothetical protein BCR33DRAFT_717074 [Rhizoclosmatium globosum]|uniref:Uncharacterized protein n=1 Tax=Rhizoclosmatium globosum TaxID=329046 RepID=A0A1Y2CAH9_9FUNG|nr:hypothetical protein BCR33DRAFT_717074 [Rhizoclosmatium globosum]|eukprot:ORY43946.1 hypothetical protein BCR33DRAFT_717074 [Rhizoclosmatium globosum]
MLPTPPSSNAPLGTTGTTGTNSKAFERSKSHNDLSSPSLQVQLQVVLPTPSTFSTNESVVFKNDQIFKIKAIEAYLAPASLPSHLSFRKGQAFYALNHNDLSKTFFVSTEYATPFSRTAVNGVVPDRYFEIVELNTGKNKNKGKEPAFTQAKVDASRHTSNTPSTNANKSSLASMALLAALQKEQEQQYIQQSSSRTSGSNTPSTSMSTATTPTNRNQHHPSARTRMTEAGAELERELRNALSQADINAKAVSHPPQHPQPPIPTTSSSEGTLRRSLSRGREMFAKFVGVSTSDTSKPASKPIPADEAPPMPNLSENNAQHPPKPASPALLSSNSLLPSSSSETPTAMSHTSTTSSGGVRGASFMRMLKGLLPSGSTATASTDSHLLNTKPQPKPTTQNSTTPSSSFMYSRTRSHSHSTPSTTSHPKTPTGTSTTSNNNTTTTPSKQSFLSRFNNHGTSARTPNAPTAPPSAVSYLTMKSPAGTDSAPGTPSFSTLAPPPIPEIPSVYHNQRSGTSSSHLFLPSDADLAAYPVPQRPVGGTTFGGHAASAAERADGLPQRSNSQTSSGNRLKSSLKKSSSSFWG